MSNMTDFTRPIDTHFYREDPSARGFCLCGSHREHPEHEFPDPTIDALPFPKPVRMEDVVSALKDGEDLGARS